MKPKTLRELDQMDSMLDSDFSNDRAVRIGVANAGKKLPPASEELRKKRKTIALEAYRNGRPNPMAGKTFSNESRAKLSNAHLGKQKSQEHKSNISAGKKGKSYGGNLKPVSTPYGVFASLIEAGKYEETITGKKFNPNRFTKLIKDPSSGYKRITQEEYIKCRKKTV